MPDADPAAAACEENSAAVSLDVSSVPDLSAGGFDAKLAAGGPVPDFLNESVSILTSAASVILAMSVVKTATARFVVRAVRAAYTILAELGMHMELSGPSDTYAVPAVTSILVAFAVQVMIGRGGAVSVHMASFA